MGVVNGKFFQEREDDIGKAVENIGFFIRVGVKAEFAGNYRYFSAGTFMIIYSNRWTLGKGFGMGVVLLQAALKSEHPGSPVSSFHVVPPISDTIAE